MIKYIKMDLDVAKLPLMKSCCVSCPFKKNEKGVMQNVPLANKVIERTLFQGQQICHHTQDAETEEAKNRCKGSYDHNYSIYEQLGMNPNKNIKN